MLGSKICPCVPPCTRLPHKLIYLNLNHLQRWEENTYLGIVGKIFFFLSLKKIKIVCFRPLDLLICISKEYFFSTYFFVGVIKKQLILPYWGGGSESCGHVRNVYVFWRLPLAVNSKRHPPPLIKGIFPLRMATSFTPSRPRTAFSRPVKKIKSEKKIFSQRLCH